MSATKDLRRHRRIPYPGPIRISWEDQGQPRFAMAKCIDISESGLCIESPQPVRPGANIQVGAERIKLAGAATVKHVVRNGSKFLLGVQLTQVMRGQTLQQIEGLSPVVIVIENFNRLHQKV
jgi:hypothetical protein